VRVLRRAGPWLAYVARSAAVSRHRTGSATASLVLAVAMTTGLGIMIRSFRDSVGIWLDEALPADVYVGVRGRFGERQGTVVEPTLASELQRLSGVGAATTYRRFQTELVTPAGERRISDVCVLEATPKVLGRLPLLGDADAARRQFAAGAGALASEPLAFQLSLRAGDVVTVATDAGPRALPIAGILRDYRSARGELTLPRSWYGGDAVSSLALECAPGTDADTLEGAVWRTLRAAPQDLDVATQPSIRVGSMHVFDRSFAITAALRVLCIGIAVLGIYGAFASLQLERRHEVGVLRALGAGPAHVALLVLGQTTLLGLWAGVLSLPVGIGIGHALVHVVNRGSFGWTLLEVEWPPALLGEALLLSLGAAFVAGLEPAWRMVRTAPATALRED
jgi:putative ABC transport system permease protein